MAADYRRHSLNITRSNAANLARPRPAPAPGRLPARAHRRHDRQPVPLSRGAAAV